MAKLSDTAQRALEKLSAEHCVARMGGKVKVSGWEPSPLDSRVKVIRFYDKGALRDFYLPQKIKVPGFKGPVPAFDYWMEWQGRPTATGVVVDPSEAPMALVGGQYGKLNLWQGLGLRPRPGSWKLLRRHIIDVLAGGDEAHGDYIIRWSAYAVQHPTEPCDVALVFRGAKGVGKGIFGRLVCTAFGPAHSAHITQRDHLVGKFNAHFLQTCIVFADECLWPGHQADDAEIKRLITEPWLEVEPKGVDTFRARNMLKFVFAGNGDWVVKASDDERRYAVFDVADHVRNDRGYFGPLYEEIRNGGAAAFLHDLLQMDLGDWHPRFEVPESQALAAQKMEGARAEHLWLGAILAEGVVPRSINVGGERQDITHHSVPHLVRPGPLFEHAKRSDKRLRYWSPQKFWAFLDSMGIVSSGRDKHGKWRQLPPLAEMRQQWMADRPWWTPPLTLNAEAKWEFEDEK